RRSPKGSSKGISPRTLLLLLAAGPARRVPVAGRGAWVIPLFGWSGLPLIEKQFAMLLEYSQRPFERMEDRLSNLRGVARNYRKVDDYALASDVGPHFGNVAVGLGKMTANHRIER